MDENREKSIFRLLPLNLNLTRFSVTFALKLSETFSFLVEIKKTEHGAILFYCRTHLQYFLGKREEISFKQFVKKLKKVQLIYSVLCSSSKKEKKENLTTIAVTIRRQQKK